MALPMLEGKAPDPMQTPAAVSGRGKLWTPATGLCFNPFDTAIPKVMAMRVIPFQWENYQSKYPGQ